MRSFELQSKLPYFLFTLAMPTVLSVVAVVWLFGALVQPEQRGHLWLVILWLGGLAAAWYKSLWMPYRIEVTEDHFITFVSLLGRTTVSPRDVISIKQRTFDAGFLQLKYTGGKLRMLNQFTGFHDFVHFLKEANPGVEIRGC